MDIWQILLDVVILLGAGALLGGLFERAGQSALVGYLLAGALLGPNVTHVIQNHDEVLAVSEIGVALLLFAIGLEFSWARLRGMGRVALNSGVLQVAATIAIGVGVAVVPFVLVVSVLADGGTAREVAVGVLRAGGIGLALVAALYVTFHSLVHGAVTDARYPEVLEQARLPHAAFVAVTVPGTETAVQVVRYVRLHARHAQILVRARFHRSLVELEAAGADVIVDEEHEVGRQLAKMYEELTRRSGQDAPRAVR